MNKIWNICLSIGILALGAAVVLLYLRVIGLEEAHGVYRSNYKKIISYDNSIASHNAAVQKKKIEELEENSVKLRRDVNQANNAIKKLEEASDKLNTMISDLDDELDGISGISTLSLDDLEDKLKELNDDLDELKSEVSEIETALDKHALYSLSPGEALADSVYNLSMNMFGKYPCDKRSYSVGDKTVFEYLKLCFEKIDTVNQKEDKNTADAIKFFNLLSQKVVEINDRLDGMIKQWKSFVRSY